MNILITGANRGIGLGFVKHYLKAGHQVWACYRTDCSKLNDLPHDNLQLLRWDVTDTAPDLKPHLNRIPESIDILINNAGVYGPKNVDGQSLDTITPKIMHEVFAINCVGALNVVQHMLVNVKQMPKMMDII